MQRGYDPELCMEDGCVHGATHSPALILMKRRVVSTRCIFVNCSASKKSKQARCCFVAFGALALLGGNNSGKRRQAVRHGVCGWT